MSVVYTADSASTTLNCRYRAVGPDGFGNYTYTQRRGFIPFDLFAAGIGAGTVESAQLILRCTTVVGGSVPVQLRSAVDPNGFGATLDSTHADWASTQTFTEDTQIVDATGVWTWDVDPAHLSYTGPTYFSLFDEDEGAGASFQTAAVFNSSEAGTPANRPILRLTLRTGQLIFVQVM